MGFWGFGVLGFWGSHAVGRDEIRGGGRAVGGQLLVDVEARADRVLDQAAPSGCSGTTSDASTPHVEHRDVGERARVPEGGIWV